MNHNKKKKKKKKEKERSSDPILPKIRVFQQM